MGAANNLALSYFVKICLRGQNHCGRSPRRRHSFRVEAEAFHQTGDASFEMLDARDDGDRKKGVTPT